MQDGKALQAGTSHYLGTNFAKAFETRYLNQTSELQYVHQTSWGVSTRLIGGIIMAHSDDRGLVLPPKLAYTQVIIIPIINAKTKADVLSAAHTLQVALEKKGITTTVDSDDTKQFGAKCYEAELTGIPIRIELGHREILNQTLTFIRRDDFVKKTVSFESFLSNIHHELDLMQVSLLQKALTLRNQNTIPVSNWNTLKQAIEGQQFAEGSWCKSASCEEKIKAELKATIRCIIIDQECKPVQTEEICCVCQKNQNNVSVIIARNY
jgi:prolyl-tRNA synthetase